MKFKIFGTIFVVFILIVLYVMFSAVGSSPEGEGAQPTVEVQQ